MRFTIPAAAFLVGLAAGVLAARSTTSSRGPSTPAEHRREAPAPARSVTSMDEAGLRRTAAEQAREIARLKEQIARGDAAPAPTKAPVDKRARAIEIQELFAASQKAGDFSHLLRALSTLDEVDEAMAATFIERYQPGEHNSLMLILLAGGPEAAAFVVKKLSDPSLPAAERDAILRNLSGTGGAWITQKLPFNAAIASQTATLLASRNPLERAAAAGLLGGSDTDDARGRLRALMTGDGDANVRAAAISSLGWIGDRAALAHLQTLPREPNAWAVNQALDRAIEQLKERFPQ